MRKFIEPILHILFWLLVFYISYSNFGVKIRIVKTDVGFSYIKEYNSIFLAVTLIHIIFKALLFYGAIYWFLPLWMKSKNKAQPTVKLALWFVSTLSSSLVLNYFVLGSFFEHPIKKGPALVGYSIFFHFVYLFIAIGYRLTKDWFKNEKLKNEIIQEKLHAELNFLKAQINPHFIFNTLNNLYAEARKHEDKTVADGIAKLSQMMRYMIYDSNVEKVTLAKEIQYLNSYIELQKFRFSEEDPIDLKISLDIKNPSVRIAPIIFIPFVENAFKHGIQIEHRSFIHLSLTATDHGLVFKLSNRKFNTETMEKNSGVGLKNVKRRLALLYPDKHQLEVKENQDSYYVKLTLQF